MEGERLQAAYEIVRGDARHLSDVSAFIETLDHLDSHSGAKGLFDPRADLYVARAPGRLDVMGGIADYSGSLVLELPIAEATLDALQRDEEPLLRIVKIGRAHV